MHRGTISLVDKKGGTVKIEKYDGLKERNETIDKWKKLYGEGIKSCYIHIRPDTPEVKDVEIIPESIRPSAAYNNIPVYDYQEKKNGHGT